MVSQHWLCCDHDADCALSTVLDLVSFVYFAVCNFCLGCLDPTQFRHVGQLLAVGHHRHCGTDQNVDDVKKPLSGLFIFVQAYDLGAVLPLVLLPVLPPA